MRLVNATSGDPIVELNHRNRGPNNGEGVRIVSTAISSKGDLLATTDNESAVCVHRISDKTRQFVEYAPSSGAIYSSKQIDFLSFGGPTAPSILAMGWRSLTGATMLTLLDTRTGKELVNEERPAVRSIAWNPVTVRMEALSQATGGSYNKDSKVDASSARILLVVSFEDNKCVVYDATDAIHPPPPPPESEASRASSPAGAKSTPKGTAGSVEPQAQDGEATEEGEADEEEEAD